MQSITTSAVEGNIFLCIISFLSLDFSDFIRNVGYSKIIAAGT